VPRAPRALPAPFLDGKRHRYPVRVQETVHDAITDLAVYHIAAIRRRRGGEIIAVKHITLGWISVAAYGKLQIIKKLEPYAIQIIRGGYQLKAWIWATEIPLEFLASGTALPFGIIVVVVALALSAIDAVNGNQLYAAIDLIALALPWGELWLIYRGLSIFFSFILNNGGVPSPSNPLGLFSNGWIDLGLSLIGGGGPLAALGEAQLIGQGINALINWFNSLGL